MRLHPYLEHGGPIAFAHRGGALEHPENTMRAFAAAIDLGYTYLETDAQATSDGIVVAFHDDTLDRMTNLKGRIEERSFRELAQARVAGTDAIPRIEELLSAFPEARINIDVKSDAVVEPLAKVLREADCLERICLASTSRRRTATLREIFGEKLCTALAPDEVVRLRYRVLWRGRGAITGRCAQVPRTRTYRGLPLWRLDEAFIAAAHRLNIPVHVWTINEAQEMDALLDMAVDGIMTDRPRLLAEVLDERAMWWPGISRAAGPSMRQ